MFIRSLVSYLITLLMFCEHSMNNRCYNYYYYDVLLQFHCVVTDLLSQPPRPAGLPPSAVTGQA